MKKRRFRHFSAIPYCAAQKPHVENLIKTLCRFFFKGSDLNNYSQKQIDFAFAVLNNKPRKRLVYKKPFVKIRAISACFVCDLSRLTKALF